MDDEDGFTAFFRASYSRVVAQVYPIVGSFAEAEEIQPGGLLPGGHPLGQGERV